MHPGSCVGKERGKLVNGGCLFCWGVKMTVALKLERFFFIRVPEVERWGFSCTPKSLLKFKYIVAVFANV